MEIPKNPVTTGNRRSRPQAQVRRLRGEAARLRRALGQLLAMFRGEYISPKYFTDWNEAKAAYRETGHLEGGSQ